MEKRNFKLLVVWNIILTVMLIASLGANAAWAQAANDPPVKVFTASVEHVGADGSDATATVAVNSSSPVVLLSIPVRLGTAHAHICVVAASASTVPTTASYHTVGLSMDDDSAIAPASARGFYGDGSFDTPAVSTNHSFKNLTGNHTFYFLASGTPLMNVHQRSMFVVCMKKVI